MSLQNRKLVAEALRSGKFNQGRHALCQLDNSGNHYCCLGVACEVFIENGGTLERHRSSEDSVLMGYGDDDETATCPKVVQEWLGINATGERNEGPSLIGLNDGEEWNFLKIADVFENGDFILPGVSPLPVDAIF
jgi:hypothetical protein